MMDPWLEKADTVLYYEDLCVDFESTIAPVLEDLGMADDMPGVLERSTKRGKRYRLGCPGIGQHKTEWSDKHYKLYEEVFGGREGI